MPCSDSANANEPPWANLIFREYKRMTEFQSNANLARQESPPPPWTKDFSRLKERFEYEFAHADGPEGLLGDAGPLVAREIWADRKSTRLNSSH